MKNPSFYSYELTIKYIIYTYIIVECTYSVYLSGLTVMVT